MQKLTPKQKEMLLLAKTGPVLIWGRHEAKIASGLEDKKLGTSEPKPGGYWHFTINDAGRKLAEGLL